VPRIILIDDSQSARTLIGLRLREHGYEVLEAPDGITGAELALTSAPAAVVTDQWMPGVSGLQLCRLLHAEPATARVPVVLLTASDDRRTRFWARQGGAAAFVTKTEIERLVLILANVLAPDGATAPPTSATASALPRGGVQARISQLLDSALYESTIAGEVRALARCEDIESMFTDLCRLAADVASYRWLALARDSPHGPPLLLHAAPGARNAAEREAKDALGLAVPVSKERRNPAAATETFALEDARALGGDGGAPPLVAKVAFHDAPLGVLALAPSRRGASDEDRELTSIVAAELGVPMRMVGLVAEARRLAATDALTDLMNRRAFLEAIERTRREREAFPWSLLLLDVDHFKKVNDTHGHDAGDAVLQGLSRVLAKLARKSDLVARWGGEEFVVALVQTAEAGARIAAERVRRAIAEARFTLPNGTPLQTTASIGIASALSADWTLDELLSRADKAMYNAKHRGRNRVETA
jgi:two-component system cell cycle response regulator